MYFEIQHLIRLPYTIKSFHRMKKNNLFLFAAIVFMIFVVSYSLIRDTYRDTMLKDTHSTLGILIENSSGTARHSANGTFKYTVNNKTYSFKQYEDYSCYCLFGKMV